MKEDQQQLQPRDRLLRDTFTLAETFLFSIAILLSVIAFWLGDPLSSWLLGALIIIGCLTPAILKTHEHHHPFFTDLLWPKFWICSAPVWALMLQFAIGLMQDPIAKIKLGSSTYNALETISIWRPTATVNLWTWLILFGFCAVYIISTCLYIVPKSRSFFERLFPWLCFGAVLVGLFGYLQRAIGVSQPLLTGGTQPGDFFAFFPYDGHWAAFATLWCCACIAMALLNTRYEDSPPFINSVAPWYLTGGIILGSSGFMVEAHLPAAALLITLAVMLLILAVHLLVKTSDRHRIPIAICSILAASFYLTGGVARILNESAFTQNSSALRQAAWEMFLDSPIFGWGINSYEKLLPYYGSDFLIGERYERANSDLLQIAAEFGSFGLLIITSIIVALLVRHLRRERTVHLTNHMLMGCGSVFVLACFDTPFMSPAVFASACIISFSALRWSDLSQGTIDEVDAVARPQLVTPESKRKVPYFKDNQDSN